MCLRAWFWPPRFRVPVRAHWRTEAIDAWTGPRWQRAADKAGARRSTRGVRGERGVTQALLVTRSLFFAGGARNAGLSRAMCLACACEVPSPPPRDSAATGYGGAGAPRCMLVAFAREPCAALRQETSGCGVVDARRGMRSTFRVARCGRTAVACLPPSLSERGSWARRTPQKAQSDAQ
ncbi:hypothetical protein ERJ75_001388200 [Trypanosoma vivax]|nr:hypothetical protein ERJ75_001388200 [Trypanosoma vivax]